MRQREIFIDMSGKNIDWYGKPYYSLDAYFKNTFGKKCYKLAVDAGFTCPNRDGSIDSRGCIFCAEGSGTFADRFEPGAYVSANGCCSSNAFDEEKVSSLIDLQIQNGLMRFDKKVGDSYMIYFQSYTNTYGSIDYLRTIYESALKHENVIGISIGTRPDCLGEDVINLLSKLKEKYSGKFIWVELGLQTIHEKTAKYIRRGYPLSVYANAVKRLEASGLEYITHVILGLPGETKEMMLDTVKYVSNIGAKSHEKMDKKSSFMCGIKLQLLHVLKGTDLAEDYAAGAFDVLSMEEYFDIICDSVNLLDERMVIHRITGDGPKSILIAPTWSGNKKYVLNSLHKMMKEKNVIQGSKCGATV